MSQGCRKSSRKSGCQSFGKIRQRRYPGLQDPAPAVPDDLPLPSLLTVPPFAVISWLEPIITNTGFEYGFFTAALAGLRT